MAGSDECKIGTLMPHAVADSMLYGGGKGKLYALIWLRDLSPVESKGQGVRANEGGLFGMCEGESRNRIHHINGFFESRIECLRVG